MAMRASAMRSCVTVCSASGLPNATRCVDAPAHGLERALGDADQPHAVVDAPGAEPPLRDLEAAALAEQQVRSRARARPRNSTSAWPPGASS